MNTALPAERQKAFDALYNGAMQKDPGLIRSALTDDFIFRGPMMSFDDPEAFADSLLDFDAEVTESRLIVDGERAAHLFVLDVAAPIRARIPMCDILEFRGSLIRAIRLYTDSKLFEPSGG